MICAGVSQAMNWVWVYLIFPFVGSGLAVLFYQYVYLKTKINTFQGEEEDEINNETKE